MAYTQGLCSAIQVNLNEIAGSNAPALSRQKVGMIDGLMSAQNRNGFTAQVVPTNGKYRAVQINYIGQACDSDVVTSCAPNCTPEVEPEPLEKLITEFNCAKYKMGFDEAEMRKLCEADSVWVGQNIMRAMNAINVSVDKALITAINPLVTDTTSLPLFTTSGFPNPMAWPQVISRIELAGHNGAPIIVGGSSSELYAKAQAIACCNTVAGMDLAAMSGNAFYYFDPQINSIQSATDFYGWTPGAIQMITWNKYLGEYAKRDSSFEHGTIVDPFTGLVYDLKTSYDDCTEKWYVELALNWNIIDMPAAFCTEDDNGIYKFEDCSTGPIACPAP